MGQDNCVELFDKESGRVLNRERIVPPWPLLYAGDNFLLLLGPPSGTAEGQQPGNFCVIRYRYSPSFR